MSDLNSHLSLTLISGRETFYCSLPISYHQAEKRSSKEEIPSRHASRSVSGLKLILEWNNDRRAHEISTFAGLLKHDNDRGLVGWSGIPSAILRSGIKCR